MANAVTKSDVKKFLALVKIGLEEGRGIELRNYTSADNYDGTDVTKDYYVSLDFTFRCSREAIEKLIAEDAIDNEVKDLLKEIKP